MNDDKKSTEIKRGRGRPSLSPAEKEQKSIIRKQKNTVYQERYRIAHPKRAQEKYYQPKVIIKKEFKQALDKLLLETKLSITSLFIGAVEEKYGIKLSEDIDSI